MKQSEFGIYPTTTALDHDTEAYLRGILEYLKADGVNAGDAVRSMRRVLNQNWMRERS